MGGNSTTFVYDGEGNLVKKIRPDNTSVVYICGVYEMELNAGGSITKKTGYYPGGAMRVEVGGVSNTLYFMLRDPNEQLLEMACFKFVPPAGYTVAEVLSTAHRLRVAAGDCTINDSHLADAIAELAERKIPVLETAG